MKSAIEQPSLETDARMAFASHPRGDALFAIPPLARIKNNEMALQLACLCAEYYDLDDLITVRELRADVSIIMGAMETLDIRPWVGIYTTLILARLYKQIEPKGYGSFPVLEQHYIENARHAESLGFLLTRQWKLGCFLDPGQIRKEVEIVMEAFTIMDVRPWYQPFRSLLGARFYRRLKEQGFRVFNSKSARVRGLKPGLNKMQIEFDDNTYYEYG